MRRNLPLAPAKNQVNERAERWWRELPAAERRDLAAVRGRRPLGVFVRFVEQGEAADDDPIDFYEFLINHEVYLDDGRTFHICSAHPAARARFAAGYIPRDFSCPRSDDACPIRALLAVSPDHDVKLSLAPSNPRTVE